jgi:predicted DNA binding CopG/RHH family protein
MKTKTESVLIRVSSEEKEAFGLSASLAGISLSSWIRERLRLAAIRELEAAGKRVPFVPEVQIPEL